jgi:hypothetical protein
VIEDTERAYEEIERARGAWNETHEDGAERTLNNDLGRPRAETETE